jgi:hypothetical protein
MERPELKPPSPLLATGPYGFAYSGTLQADGSIRHVIAARSVSADYAVTALDALLADGTDIQVIAPNSTAALATVQVAPAPPETVMYLDNLSFDVGTGTLMLADLTQDSARAQPVPGGQNVVAGGTYFGPNGASILFFGDFNPNTRAARVFWSRGTGEPLGIGQDGDSGTVVLSRDRNTAILGVNATYSTGVGDLLSVDMRTGETEVIGRNVVLRALAYRQQDPRLSSALELAFSVTPDGNAVAFAGSDNAVHLWRRGRGLTTVSSGGRFPALTTDGETVIFFEGANLAVWNRGSVIRRLPAAGGQLAPLISPDNHYVAYLTDFRQRGQNAIYGRTLGTVAVISLKTPDAPETWARSVAWHSVDFGLSGETTKQISMLANCRDLTGFSTLDSAIADLVVGHPALAPTPPVAKAISPYLTRLPLSNSWAFVGTEDVFTASVKFNANLWSPKSGEVQTLALGAVIDSLQSGEQLATLTGAPSPHSDQILYLTPESRNPSFKEVGASLWGAAPATAPFKVQEHVVYGTLANDGRVITVQAIEDSADRNVWLLPFSGQ